MPDQSTNSGVGWTCRNVVFGALAMVFSGGAVVSTSAHALVPPMSPEELREASDIIVSGSVQSVETSGKPYDDKCYTWQDYRAVFAVKKAEKGKPKRSITLLYSDIVKNEKGCVGGKTPYSMHQGGHYRLYLKRSASEDAAYRFINWAGVTSEKPASDGQ